MVSTNFKHFAMEYFKFTETFVLIYPSSLYGWLKLGFMYSLHWYSLSIALLLIHFNNVLGVLRRETMYNVLCIVYVVLVLTAVGRISRWFYTWALTSHHITSRLYHYTRQSHSQPQSQHTLSANTDSSIPIFLSGLLRFLPDHLGSGVCLMLLLSVWSWIFLWVLSAKWYALLL